MKVYIVKRVFRKGMLKVKKKIIAAVCVMSLLTMVSVPAGYAHATELNWSKVIYPGIYIEGIDVGGKKLEEAESLVKEKYETAALLKKIEIIANNKTYKIDFSKLQGKYNIHEVAAAAYSYGKEENIINRYRLIKSPEKKEFKLTLNYNSKHIDEVLDEMEKEVNQKALPAKITVVNDQIKIIPEVDGVSLLKDKLREAIISQIEGELTREAIKLEAPIEIIKPELTAEKLSSINNRVSSFSTAFATSTVNRINNIQLATKAISGTILMPGEIFSFNRTVGERTQARGYKEAGVIVGDKIESGIGGGICQVSSTLYNAMLRTNLPSVERRNHSLPLAYIGKGLDATVNWGNIDYKFKNTLAYPVYIEGHVENKRVYFNVYSSQELAKRTYKMVTEVIDVIEPKIKYIDNPDMNSGEEEVIKKPSTGYKVKVYRKTYENGKLINTEVVSSDTYRAVNGEIMR